MEHLLAGLNRAQHEAVTATEGYVRVIAGAGSGKTRALSHRFAYLVNELGILPGNILCVTFTNKSANEMRQRIHALTGDNDTGYINTFHGFCVSVLQEDSHAVQYPKSFLVLDNSDIDAMLGIIYEERGLTLRDMTYSAARDMIEIRKLFKEPEYYKDMITMSLDTLREKYERADTAGDIIFYGYLYQEKKCFGLDYNDLIKFSLYIFEQHEDIRLKWQQRLERQISAGFRQGLSKRADHHDDGKLPFHAGDFGGGELADRKKRPPHQKGPAPDEALGREGRLPLCRHAGGGGALDGGRDEAAA